MRLGEECGPLTCLVALYKYFGGNEAKLETQMKGQANCSEETRKVRPEEAMENIDMV